MATGKLNITIALTRIQTLTLTLTPIGSNGKGQLGDGSKSDKDQFSKVISVARTGA